MPRKAKRTLEEHESQPLARKPRSKKTEAVAETLDQLKAELRALQTATAEAEPPHRELIEAPKPDRDVFEPPVKINGDDRGLQGSGSFAAAARASRPTTRSHSEGVDRPVFGPIPDDFFAAGSRRDEGIRVLKKTTIRNGDKVSVAGIQFASNRTPSRQEKDLLEQIHEPDEAVADKEKFTYQPAIQVWTREGDPHDRLGDNTLDAIRKMNEMADARKEDRERMQEVMGR